MFKWKINRPLAIFDLEATGTSPRADRIVEVAITRLLPDGTRDTFFRRVKPGIPIPAEATGIHGICDADVADCPAFPDLAAELFRYLKDCDLGGYNIVRFDVPMLVEEFSRADINFDTEDRRMIDAQRIFHRREPRDLSAALSYYCGEMHLNAHGAEADVEATVRILEAQLQRYPDLPHDIEELHEYCNPRDPTWVDRTGRLKWMNGQVALNFGRKKGTSLRAMIDQDPGFIKWMMRSDFPRDTREIIQNALEGKWPTLPSDLSSGNE